MTPERLVIEALRDGDAVVTQPYPDGLLVLPVQGRVAIDILELGSRVERWCALNSYRPVPMQRFYG